MRQRTPLVLTVCLFFTGGSATAQELRVDPRADLAVGQVTVEDNAGMVDAQRAVGTDSALRRSVRNSQQRLLSRESLQPEPARVRSTARTWTGIGMMAGGLGMALYNQKCALVGPSSSNVLGVLEWRFRAIERDGECWVGGTAGVLGDDGEFLNGGEELPLMKSYETVSGTAATAERGRGALSKNLRYTGVGLAVTGALIAIFWSDVVPSAAQNLDVGITPTGWKVSRSIGW